MQSPMNIKRQNQSPILARDTKVSITVPPNYRAASFHWLSHFHSSSALKHIYIYIYIYNFIIFFFNLSQKDLSRVRQQMIEKNKEKDNEKAKVNIKTYALITYCMKRETYRGRVGVKES